MPVWQQCNNQKEQKREEDSMAFHTCNSDFVCNIHYPQENSEGAEEAITKTLAYLGVFDGVNADEASNSTM